jgi:hypothetical protein
MTSITFITRQIESSIARMNRFHIEYQSSTKVKFLNLLKSNGSYPIEEFTHIDSICSEALLVFPNAAAEQIKALLVNFILSKIAPTLLTLHEFKHHLKFSSVSKPA